MIGKEIRNSFRLYLYFLRRCLVPVIPLIIILAVLLNPTKLDILEINLSLTQPAFFGLLIFGMLVWEVLPLRLICLDGRWYSVLYHLVPLEAYCLLIFAQWHFKIAVALLIVLAVLVLVWEGFMLYECFHTYPPEEEDEEEEQAYQQRRKENRRLMARIPLLLALLVLLVPSGFAVTVYEMGSPVYKPNPENAVAVYLPSTEADKILEENAQLLACFAEGTWQQYDFSEKLTLLEQLHSLECARLGVTPVPIKAEGLKKGTLAAYNSGDNDITVSTEYLNTATAAECMRTMCHETFHRHQCYLMDNLDETDPLLQTAYFAELRDWFANADNYVTGSIDFDAYTSQPLEASANAWADAEMAAITPWIPQS